MSNECDASERVPDPPTEPDPVLGGDDWKGETHGDAIAGIVEVRETKSTDKFGGKDFEVLTIRNGDDTERKVACARMHLAQLVAEHDPQPGDGIAITYFGPEPGELTERYAMRVEKADQEGSSDEIPF